MKSILIESKKNEGHLNKTLARSKFSVDRYVIGTNALILYKKELYLRKFGELSGKVSYAETKSGRHSIHTVYARLAQRASPCKRSPREAKAWVWLGRPFALFSVDVVFVRMSRSVREREREFITLF